MKTGAVGFVGSPPVVTVTERMLLSQVPEEERATFVQCLTVPFQYTRSGDIVFAKEIYAAWKKQ